MFSRQRLFSRSMRLLMAVMAFSLVFSGCEKDDDDDHDDDDDDHDEYVIFRMTLTNTADATDVFTVEWKDLDGKGGNPPSADTIFLKPGMSYSGSVRVFEMDDNKLEDETADIEKDKNEKRFFYTPSSEISGIMKVDITDFDNLNPPQPVGLKVIVSTTSGGTLPVVGSVNVILSEYDDHKKTNTPSNDIEMNINIPVVVR